MRDHYQRARSESEKAHRRDAILGAADRLIHAHGPDGFSMSELAREAGIAKGTVYLYFDTRESVLLAVYVARFGAFCEHLASLSHPGIEAREFCRRFREASYAHPLIVTLGARLTGNIGSGVAPEAFADAKREMHGQKELVGRQIEGDLQLRPGAGLDALYMLIALMLGAEQLDFSSSIEEDMPDDVQRMMRDINAERVFLTGAELIFRGLRDGPHHS